ncbi:MAG TPA: pirin family protein [Acidothermaceae bacterium]
MPVDVRLAGDRFESHGNLVVSRHSFSYGPHYDPANTRFGPLVAHNDDVLAPGGGFPEHPHRDLEIVTWVLVGALEHGDSTGGSGVLTPGMVGRLRTGAGVRHVERNASSGATRYLQMWLIPDADGPASYANADVSAALGDDFVVVASSDPGAPVSLARAGASLFVGQFRVRARVPVPASAFVHVFVARGAVSLTAAESVVELTEGDAARLIEAEAAHLDVRVDAEVLIWTFAR